MKVRQLIRELYPLSGDYGFTAVMGTEGYVGAINDALTYVYSFGAKRRNRQIRTEATWKSPSNNNQFQGVTTRPITDVLSFRCGEKLECIKDIELKRIECCNGGDPFCSTCGTCVDCTSCCTGPANAENMIENMKQISPGGVLHAGSYKISGGQDGMGGTFGNFIQGQLHTPVNCDNCQCKQLYFTYVAWFNPITCIHDEIPLPRAYITALKFVVLSFIISRYITFRANDDTWYITQAEKLITNLDLMQVNIPTFIRGPSRS